MMINSFVARLTPFLGSEERAAPSKVVGVRATTTLDQRVDPSHWPPHPLGPGCLIRGCTHTLGHQIANHRSQDMDCPICGANAEQIPTTIDDVSIVCPM